MGVPIPMVLKGDTTPLLVDLRRSSSILGVCGNFGGKSLNDICVLCGLVFFCRNGCVLSQNKGWRRGGVPTCLILKQFKHSLKREISVGEA